MSAKTNKNSSSNGGGSFNSIFPYIAILACFGLALFIYFKVYGAPHHFIDDNPENDPKPGDYMGMVFKGGPVVPVLHTFFFMVIVFSIERAITIFKAVGKSSVSGFVKKIKALLDRGDINGALAACDQQQGSVANVVRAGLVKYTEMEKAPNMELEEKVEAIKHEVEEATTLEMPALERNMIILSTLASISTLFALFGTVLGMIRAFAALSNSGAPDSTALATGISEALINTALGIFTSAFAIIFYNFFSLRVDKLTYRIDEAAYSLAETFASRNR